MNTVIELHALQNFAPSNLNRDDTGAPKDAMFGGTRRARISSQCLKRATRRYFSDLVVQNILNAEDLAYRTKRIQEEIKRYLVEKGRAEAEAREKARLALAAMGFVVKGDGKTEYLLFLGRNEISTIAAVIDAKWDSIIAPQATPEEGKRPGKAKKQAAQNADPELKKALANILDGGKALDVALFGRMLADMPEKNQDASCQVAHGISTHSVDREFDFYTAVDDLKPEDTAGADMMGTVEFSAACYYRYALVDWDKLLANLQGDKELAFRGIRVFTEGFIVAEPTGKQNTFAAHNPPEFVMASVRRNAAPRNLANAFETAIRVKKDESLIEKSADALIRKAITLQAAFGGAGESYVLNPAGAETEDYGTPVATLGELIDNIIETMKR